MLTGTLAFANNSNATVISITKQHAIELIKTSTRFELENTNPEVDCLLTIIFEYTDGTKETVKVIVTGSNSAELLE